MRPATKKQDLISDLRTVVADADELLHATADQTGERIESARARAGQSLAASRARLEQLGHQARTRAREYADDVDERVHQNPWTAIGVAAGAGLVVGMLVGRRGD